MASTGHGVCAAVLENVARDDWGYPIIPDATAAAASPLARTAIRLCPARALYLTRRSRP